MIRIYCVLISIFLVTLTVTADDNCCGPNETPKDSIDCTSDCCPEDPNEPSCCPDACATACKCNLMYKRAANGTCIPARECPPIPCAENEMFDSCPVCSEDCSNANPEGRRCPSVGVIGTTVICEPACRCIDKYWRNSDGKCVPYEECPSANDTCGPNETLKDGIDCTSDCCPEDPNEPSCCPDACATACKCNLMYKRAANGTCIPARECPPIPCGKNEKFDSCPVCSEDCSNANPEGRRCPRIGRIGITVICEPACRCIDKYWRNNRNECVPYEKCPKNQGC